MAEFNVKNMKKDAERRMEGAIEVLHRELAGLRSGRASVSLLEPITVQAYGGEMPLNQVGNIGVPEPRMLTVQVWDKGLVGAVEKAIRDSNLGLNPADPGPHRGTAGGAGEGRRQVCRGSPHRRPQRAPARHGRT